MVPTHSRTPHAYVQWVSTLLTQHGNYGVVSMLSQQIGVARQTLYRWKARGQAALEAAFSPVAPRAQGSPAHLERAILTRLLEGHASYRGIQTCRASCCWGSMSAWARLPQWCRWQACSPKSGSSPMPPPRRAPWPWMNSMATNTVKATRVLVDVHSGAVWASTSPVAVDGESWILRLGQLQEQGIHWQSTESFGGRAIEEAVSTVTPEQPHHRDVWHVLHLWKPVQARLDLLVKRLEQQEPVVARQAARLAAGKGLRGRYPKSDVGAHAAQLARARYVADGLRYLSGELHRLLEVVVLRAQGIMPSSVRLGELDTVLSLLDESLVNRRLRTCSPS